jgi:phenylacetate-CoA ligase
MRSFTHLEQLALIYQFLTRYRTVAQFPWLDQATIQAYQFRQIKRQIDLAYHQTSFYYQKYTAAGIHPSDIQSWEDFKRLPTISKDDLIAHGLSLIDRRRRPAQLFPSRSSGSSGKFVTVYLDSQNFITQELQVIRMLKEFYPAYHPFDRELLIYTSEYPIRSLGGFYKVHYINNLRSPAHIFAALRRIRPAIVAVYPSILRELVAMYSSECQALGIKVIVTNSEHTSQDERDRFATVFGCPVFDEYSSEELASIAHQCGHQRYHLVQDSSYIELLQPESDREVAPGQPGELVGTCLINRAMPIIRYRQGDMAVISRDHCPCGKSAPFFAELSGRKNSSFKRRGAPDIPSGRILDWSYQLVLKLGLDIREFQIVQVSLSSVKLSIVPGTGYDVVHDSAAMAHDFRLTFGQDFAVEVEHVPSITKTSAGKHIPIRSLVGEHETSDRPYRHHMA